MEQKQEKKTGDKVKRVMTERRIKELLERPPEVIAEFAHKLELEYNKHVREIEHLTLKNEKLQKRITELENAKKPTHKYSGYPVNQDYITKLHFILSRNKNNTTFEEIVNAFYLLEPDLDEKWRNPNKSISKIISRACKFGAILRQKIYGEYGNFVYSVINQ